MDGQKDPLPDLGDLDPEDSGPVEPDDGGEAYEDQRWLLGTFVAQAQADAAAATRWRQWHTVGDDGDDGGVFGPTSHEVAPGVTLTAWWSMSSGRPTLVRAVFAGEFPQGVGAGVFPALRLTQLSAAAVLDHTGEADGGPHDLSCFATNRPNGTDGWYRDYAATFRWASARSSFPALDIAEASGVPVQRVHRWTYEARRRGHLPDDPRGVKR